MGDWTARDDRSLHGPLRDRQAVCREERNAMAGSGWNLLEAKHTARPDGHGADNEGEQALGEGGEDRYEEVAAKTEASQYKQGTGNGGEQKRSVGWISYSVMETLIFTLFFLACAYCYNSEFRTISANNSGGVKRLFPLPWSTIGATRQSLGFLLLVLISLWFHPLRQQLILTGKKYVIKPSTLLCTKVHHIRRRGRSTKSRNGYDRDQV